MNLEDILIGSILCGDAKSIEALDIVSEDDFSDLDNRLIFRTVKALWQDGFLIDVYLVAEKLRGKVETGSILQKFNSSYSGSPAPQYAKELRDQRRTERITKIINNSPKAFDEAEDKEDFVKELVNSLISEKNEHYVSTGFKEGTDKLIEHIQKHENGELTGSIKTGIKELDSRINITNGNYVTIAARASQGKTSMALSIAKNIALSGKRVLFFSYEMDILPIMMKLNSYLTYTPIENITNLEITESDKSDIISKSRLIENDNFTLITRSKPKVSVLANIIRQENKKKKVDVVMIDYIGLMTPEKTTGSRAYDVENISRSIQQMAVEEFNIPFIVLTQLNRDIEGRAEKRIMLADLRDSGAIEQNSDIVIAINRDHPELKEVENSDLTVIQILKNRMGKLGYAIVKFDPVTTEFLDK